MIIITEVINSLLAPPSLLRLFSTYRNLSADTTLDNVLIGSRKMEIFREPIKTLSRAARGQISVSRKQPSHFIFFLNSNETIQ